MNALAMRRPVAHGLRSASVFGGPSACGRARHPRSVALRSDEPAFETSESLRSALVAAVVSGSARGIERQTFEISRLNRKPDYGVSGPILAYEVSAL